MVKLYKNFNINKSHKESIILIGNFDGVDVIKTKYIGRPAGTDRAVIDGSYSYCLNLGFKSKKEHDIYQEHPLHKKFIEESKDMWEKVLVYDSVPI